MPNVSHPSAWHAVLQTQSGRYGEGGALHCVCLWGRALFSISGLFDTLGTLAFSVSAELMNSSGCPISVGRVDSNSIPPCGLKVRALGENRDSERRPRGAPPRGVDEHIHAISR